MAAPSQDNTKYHPVLRGSREAWGKAWERSLIVLRRRGCASGETAYGPAVTELPALAHTGGAQPFLLQHEYKSPRHGLQSASPNPLFCRQAASQVERPPSHGQVSMQAAKGPHSPVGATESPW